MNLDFYEMIYSIMFPIPLGLMGIFYVSIGLRGILTKRPFLVSNRWWLPIIFAAFIPIVLLPLSLSLLPSGFNTINWVHPLIFGVIGVILVTMCYQLKGYTAYAVTDTSFREALLAALEKLQLPYEERLSGIRLTSINADLRVTMWTGAGVIRVKQRSHEPVLKDVANAVNEYFRNTFVPTKMNACVISMVMGVIMVAFAIGMCFL